MHSASVLYVLVSFTACSEVSSALRWLTIVSTGLTYLVLHIIPSGKDCDSGTLTVPCESIGHDRAMNKCHKGSVIKGTLLIMTLMTDRRT